MTVASTTGFDEAKSEAFVGELVGHLNGAAVSMMVAIGHRTGLFDKLAAIGPATCAGIAAETKLDERYVREWLGAMVTGRIVMYDADAETYTLPPEHAAALTRDAVPHNLASTMQWVSVLGYVEDEIVECFRKGGGVKYEQFRRFHEVMAEESGQTVLGGLEEHILRLDDGLVDRLTNGIDVLDVGCGAGRAVNQMAATYPKSRFVGYDFSEAAIAMGKSDAERQGVSNARFEARDVAALNEADAFDLITAFDVVHDQVDPKAVLAGIHRALRVDGLFLMQDIRASSHLAKNMDHPIGPFLYTISTMHCMTVSLANGGVGLGTVWGEELATQMLEEAGFAKATVHQLPHDLLNNYYLARKA